MKKIIDLLLTIFHSHDWKPTHLITKNSKGEKWELECSCGRKGKALFIDNHCVKIYEE